MSKGGGTQTLPFANQETSYGTTTGSTTGSTTGTNSSSSTPIVPMGWDAAWRGYQPNPTGLTAEQQQGLGWMSSQLDGGDPASLAGPRSTLSGIGQRQLDSAISRTAPTLRNLAAIDPAYAAPDPITADTITARRGLEFMDGYRDPYQTEVIDSSLAQYDQDAAEARAALKGANAGAFGNKRFGVAEGQFGADSALGRAGLGANLRSQGFNTAAQLGMQDASRVLSADQSNQAASLAAAQANADAMARRQQFDAQTGLAYNAQQDQLLRDAAATTGSVAGLGTTGFGIGQGLASGLIAGGGMGQGQNLDWLQAGLPLFGSSSTGSTTGATTGSTTGTTSANASSSGYQTGQKPRSSIFGPLGSLAMGLGGLGWKPFGA